MKFLKKTDFTIYSLIKQEEKRQESTLMMIPSENSASMAVREVLGSVLTNKYSEGYPGKRYYQGQEYIDLIESECIKRIQKMFNVPFANVQPYSGSPANSAVYFALLNPQDKIMGLALSSGGHLTHGAPNITFSGKYFQTLQYTVNKKGFLDYDEIEKMALKFKPHLIVAGITHYPRALDFKRFAAIAKKVNALLMADVSHVIGLIIAGVYPNPVAYVDVITTTTHKSLRGPRGAFIMVTDKGLKRDPEMGNKINKAVFPGLQGGPHENQIGALAVALKEASSPRFKKYGEMVVVNAKVLSEELKKKGYELLTGGTDTHVLVIDLRNKDILGNTAAEALEAVGIILNRNSVPFDTSPPFYPSGIRMGTPGITSRGLGQKDMVTIAQWIDQVIKAIQETKKRSGYSRDDEKKSLVRHDIISKTAVLKKIRKEVSLLCKKYPIKKSY